MYVYDAKTLFILAVNKAAIEQYGFSEQEFLGKSVIEIRPEEDVPAFLQDISRSRIGPQPNRGLWKHRTKAGAIIDVEIVCNHLEFNGNDSILVAAHDVTEQKRSEAVRQDSMNKYRVLFEDSGDANWLIDEGKVLDCNSAARQMFGYDDSASMPTPYEMSPPNQSNGRPSSTAAQLKIDAALRSGKERFEWLHQRRNGEVFPADVCLTALTLSGRQVLLHTVRDITERKYAEEALLFKNALLEAQAESTLDGIIAVDESDRIILVNKQFKIGFDIPEELLSLREDALVRQHVMGKMQGPDEFIEKIKYIESHRGEKSNDEIRLKNGKIFDRYTAPLVDARGQYRGRISYHRDITEQKAAEERIQFLAYYDALTELPHRALLQDRMEIALADARRRGEKIAVMFLDLDQFKAINDLFGHAFGDILLKEVAKRIQNCGRERDTVARVGGDEFLILLGSIKDAADAAIAAQRIMTALNENFLIQGQSLNVNCSVGISMFPEHGADSETLIRNADAAMFRAKSDGRSKVRFFTNEMNADAQERLSMDKNLRLALDKDEFFLVYQPQIEIETGRITGFEALIRWRQPELGLVPPDKFIPVAENNGLIVPIGEWVLKTACAQARKWQDDGLAPVTMAVNVSAVQFRQEGFADLVKQVLTESGLLPEYLELELTESLLLSNVDVVFATLQGLKNVGLLLAIDDFGTGYSSLSYLKQFPVGKLKIDRTFIRDIAFDIDDAAITTAIISMAKSLRLKVIAEGVETEAQMSFLREHRCDEMQGYYFSKPISPDEAAAMQLN
jgi:diguanylate cyclase (GGDEF)-like protein/PAS domain S-box-containing protein